jgi:outer membrane beta-barrel protein
VIRIWAIVSILTLWPCAALAQQDSGGLGLDLTDDGQKTEPEKAPEEAKPEKSSRSSSSAAAAEAAKPPEPSLFSERDITAEDRVKSVQRKLYLKRGRFELAPFVTASVNDPYYTKFGLTVRGSYFLADTLAISARFAALQVLPTEDVDTARDNFNSKIFYSQPFYSLLGDMEWSPIYGKVTVANTILHFDAYLLGGVGMVMTETSGLPGRPGADLGGGMRFAVKDFLAVNVAVVNTTYVDTPTGTSKGATQNVLTLNAGISLFFPFSSTGREAE